MKRLLTGLLLLALVSPALAQDYDALIQDALARRNSGDMPGAEAVLRQAWPLAADTSEVAFLLGMVVAFQERYLEAMEIVDEALQRYPGNTDLQLGRIRILAFQGRHGEAATAVAAFRREHPDSRDAANLAGRIALYQSQPRVAAGLFADVLASEPDNLEALVGQVDAARVIGDDAAAEDYLQRAEAVAPQHADVLTRRNPEAAQLVRDHEVSIGFGRSDISQAGLADWNDRFVEYRHRHANGDQEFLRASHNHRFDLHDTQLEAGLLRYQDRAWPLEIAVAASARAEFLANWFARTGTRRLLNAGATEYGAMILTPSYQYASFSNGSTHRLQLGLEYYVPGTEAWLTPSVGMVRDQDGNRDYSWGLGAHWQASPRNRIGAAYSDYAETENLLTTDTAAWSVYWQHALADAWTLGLYATRLDRAGSYEREEYVLVLQHRF